MALKWWFIKFVGDFAARVFIALLVFRRPR